MEINKTIYKKDSKGKIRMLKISTNEGTLTQESGLLGGKTVIHTSQSNPKNVGRSNETTSTEQARLEAQSKLQKKLDEGYFETIEEAQNEVVILPMLAKTFEKEEHKIDWSTAYIQPKLDGMRCLIIIKDGQAKMMSRTGKEITTLKHIANELVLFGLNDVILDGELYAHGETFQRNMELIKKYRPGESEAVKFHCYDIVNDDPFSSRNFQVYRLLENEAIKFSDIVLTWNTGPEIYKEQYAKFLDEGYEGAMIRWGEDGYKVNGRSSNLLKVKQFIDQAFRVVDVVPSEKNPEQGVIICRLPLDTNSSTFGCGMKFSHEQRKEILKNKDQYIGQMAEVRFFEYSNDGIPRFPVCVGFRLDK